MQSHVGMTKHSSAKPRGREKRKEKKKGKKREKKGKKKEQKRKEQKRKEQKKRKKNKKKKVAVASHSVVKRSKRGVMPSLLSLAARPDNSNGSFDRRLPAKQDFRGSANKYCTRSAERGTFIGKSLAFEITRSVCNI